MLERTFRVALAQTCSTPDPDANRAANATLCARAAELGVAMVAFPENAPYLGPERDARELATEVDGPVVADYRELAREHRMIVSLGSFAEVGPGDGRIHNTSVLIGSDGEILSVYRKIHLFDVETPDGNTLEESKHIAPGDEVVIVDVGPWRIGMTICYDLRFPELYRTLSERGANLVLVPSAFTAETGRDHWLSLLRARAVENLSWVVAADQWGHHFGPRRSFGRSVVFDPWGTSVAIAPDGVGVTVGELSLDRLESVRTRFPALDHRRVRNGAVSTSSSTDTPPD